MAYDKKFKQRVLAYLGEGHTQAETTKVFKIGTTTLKGWKKQEATTGLLPPKIRNRKPKKIDLERLKAILSETPDAYLSELAEVFQCSETSIRKALKKLKITRKKRR